MKNKESDILLGLQKGEESAYRYLFDEYYTLLCAFSREFVKDDFIAQTIVCDTIFRIWEIRATLQIDFSLKSYLIKAVRNNSLRYLQSSYISRRSEMPQIDDCTLIDSPYWVQDTPLGILIEKDMELKIHQSIHALPKECYEVFCMSRFQGLSYSEIAETLGISVNTVKYHIKNAIKKLRANLKEYMVGILFFLFYTTRF